MFIPPFDFAAHHVHKVEADQLRNPAAGPQGEQSAGSMLVESILKFASGAPRCFQEGGVQGWMRNKSRCLHEVVDTLVRFPGGGTKTKATARW